MFEQLPETLVQAIKLMHANHNASALSNRFFPQMNTIHWRVGEALQSQGLATIDIASEGERFATLTARGRDIARVLERGDIERIGRTPT
jgi:hypothetical protein